MYEKSVAIALLLSFAFCVWLVLRIGGARTGEISDWFSDHMRHVEETWTFFRKGLAVYRGTFNATAFTKYPHFDMASVGVPWPEMPVTYPVGTFAVFLPPTLVGAYLHISTTTFLKAIVVYIVAVTHVALLAVAYCLREGPGRIPILIGVWFLFLNMCLHGFYDGVWVGFGAMSIAALSKQRPHASLLWFAAAASTSLKAISFVPTAAWAFYALVRSRGRVSIKVAAATPAALACAQAMWTVAVTFPYIPKPGTPTYEAARSPLWPLGTTGTFVILIGLIVAGVTIAYRNWLVAASVLLATAVTIPHAGHSWHGALLIPSALLPGALASDGNTRVTREVVAMWMFGIWEVAYGNPIFSSLEDILRRLPWT